MKFTENLKNIRSTDTKIAGGKGSLIGELLFAGFNVPTGFVIFTSAYKKFFKRGTSSEFNKEIITRCKEIGGLFAVRSSATCEDSNSESWAGELETYLNVKEEDVPDMIMCCWASLFSIRIITYKKQNKNKSFKNIKIGVIVQKMIQADVAGVCFTADPLTNDVTKIVIESSPGLGEDVVSGKITPNYYLIDKRIGKILERNEQTEILGDRKIKKLTKTCKDIEKYFGKPQDIEWAFTKNKLFILQARPITTLGAKKIKNKK